MAVHRVLELVHRADLLNLVASAHRIHESNNYD
jgi:hypothetical protein